MICSLPTNAYIACHSSKQRIFSEMKKYGDDRVAVIKVCEQGISDIPQSLVQGL